MNAADDLLAFLARTLALRSPLLLVATVGVVCAILNWRANRTVSILAAVGCGLLAAAAVGTGVLQWLIVAQQAQVGANAGDVATLMTVLGAAGSLTSAAGIGCLIAAAFVGRPRPRVPRD